MTIEAGGIKHEAMNTFLFHSDDRKREQMHTIPHKRIKLQQQQQSTQKKFPLA
jgi:hypothetical protein